MLVIEAVATCDLMVAVRPVFNVCCAPTITVPSAVRGLVCNVTVPLMLCDVDAAPNVKGMVLVLTYVMLLLATGTAAMTAAA